MILSKEWRKNKMNHKIPFPLVDFEVDKLYLQELDINNETAVNERMKLIESFIISSGWSIEEYLHKLFNSDQIN